MAENPSNQCAVDTGATSHSNTARSADAAMPFHGTSAADAYASVSNPFQ